MKPTSKLILLILVGTCAIIASFCALLTVFAGTGVYVVTQRSMLPAYPPGAHILVDKLFYRVSGLHRGDTVMLRFDINDNLSMKRIVGMPGEKIEIRDEGIYVDGRRLDEPYVAPDTKTVVMGTRVWQLGPQEYFVLGDNRPESGDSRARGPVPETNTVGRVVFRYS
jgi:signal peptidase I